MQYLGFIPNNPVKYQFLYDRSKSVFLISINNNLINTLHVTDNEQKEKIRKKGKLREIQKIYRF